MKWPRLPRIILRRVLDIYSVLFHTSIVRVLVLSPTCIPPFVYIFLSSVHDPGEWRSHSLVNFLLSYPLVMRPPSFDSAMPIWPVCFLLLLLIQIPLYGLLNVFCCVLHSSATDFLLSRPV